MEILKHLNTCKVHSAISQEENEKEWLRMRSKGIGGSDIGTICGVNGFSSPRQLYLKKTGQFEDPYEEGSAASERMMFGRLLEPVVADEYSRRSGKHVAKSPAILAHCDHPWALANLDRFIVDDTGKPYGVLECKTAGEFANSNWDDGELPESYLYQLQWYLWITGLEYGAIAALVGGNKFYYYEVFRDDELINTVLLPKAEYFWFENVLKLKQPELSHSEVDADLVANEFPVAKSKSEIVLAEETDDDLAETVFQCKKQIKELKKLEDEATNRLKEKIKDNEIAYTHNHVIKWSTVNQKRINLDKARETYPDIDVTCGEISAYRRFTVK